MVAMAVPVLLKFGGKIMVDYIVLDASGTVKNVLSCDPVLYPVNPTWIPLSSAPSGVWIGWSTPDGGTNWFPPNTN